VASFFFVRAIVSPARLLCKTMGKSLFFFFFGQAGFFQLVSGPFPAIFFVALGRSPLFAEPETASLFFPPLRGDAVVLFSFLLISGGGLS